MVRSPAVPIVVAATVIAFAACGGGGSGHRAGRVTPSTTTSTTPPSSTTAGTPSTAPPATHPPTARPGAVPSPQASCIAETPPEMARYLGLTLPQAQALAASEGYHVRVVGSDGTCSIVTQELDPRRVDVYLDRGIVTAAGTG